MKEGVEGRSVCTVELVVSIGRVWASVETVCTRRVAVVAFPTCLIKSHERKSVCEAFWFVTEDRVEVETSVVDKPEEIVWVEPIDVPRGSEPDPLSKDGGQAWQAVDGTDGR